MYREKGINMTVSGKKFNWIGLLRWIPTIFMLWFVFAMSHAPAEVSSQMSGSLVSKILEILQIPPDSIPYAELLVRKLAHITEYAVLAMTICYGFCGFETIHWKRAVVVSVGICFFYAITDEFHQLYVVGRSGQWQDVLIDTIGAILGVLVFFSIACVREPIEKCCNALMASIVFCYVGMMFLIYPLYYQDKYFNMGDAKYFFVRTLSTYMLLAVVLLLVLKCIFKKWSEMRDHVYWGSVTDWLVIAYAIIVVASYYHSPYKDTALWGYDGWYMGLASQLLFVAIYFLVSRWMVLSKWLIVGTFFAASITHILAILHRFQIDPLGMYENVADQYFILFLSTLGQATWYSSYLCIVLPLGIMLYWNSKKKIIRVPLGGYIFLGGASLVTQNSDSAFFALFFIGITMMLLSLKEKEKMLRFLEVLMIFVASFVSIGILQRAFPEKAMVLDRLSIFFSQGLVMKIALVFLVVCYMWVYWKCAHIEVLSWNVKKVQWLIVGSLMVFVGLTFLGIVLVTTENMPEQLGFLNNISYLNFNDEWGSSRGFSWKISAKVFTSYPWDYKLIGCGPDAFASYAYDVHYDEITQLWDSVTLTNAHNEWFTAFLFHGILGGVAYIGIFISQIVRCGKRIAQNPLLSCVVVTVVSYIAHNFFCYQQIICTPLIFIVLGVGELGCRKIRSSPEI